MLTAPFVMANAVTVSPPRARAAPRLPRGTSAGAMRDSTTEPDRRQHRRGVLARGQDVLQLGEERCLGAGHAAAEDHDVDVERHGAQLYRPRCRSDDVAATGWVTTRGATGAERLRTTDLAAVADGSDLAHRDVPDLPGAASRSPPHMAAEHEAGGDARADVDVCQRRRRRHAEVGERPEGSGVDVVLDVHGATEPIGEHGGDGDRRSDAEVDAELTITVRHVDPPGDADADAIDGRAVGRPHRPS